MQTEFLIATDSGRRFWVEKSWAIVPAPSLSDELIQRFESTLPEFRTRRNEFVRVVGDEFIVDTIEGEQVRCRRVPEFVTRLTSRPAFA